MPMTRSMPLNRRSIGSSAWTGASYVCPLTRGAGWGEAGRKDPRRFRELPEPRAARRVAAPVALDDEPALLQAGAVDRRLRGALAERRGGDAESSERDEREHRETFHDRSFRPHRRRLYTGAAGAVPRRRREAIPADRPVIADGRTGRARGGRGDGRRLEVGDQVVRRLEPDRQSDEVARSGERRVRRGGVRHPGGVLDEALDAAERLGELPDRCAADQADRLLLRLGEEAHHPAEVGHLARGDLVARVVVEVW